MNTSILNKIKQSFSKECCVDPVNKVLGVAMKKFTSYSLQTQVDNAVSSILVRYPPELLKMSKRLPSAGEELNLHFQDLQEYDRIREDDFIAKILYWSKPTLDTTWFAMKLLGYIGEYNINKNAEILESYIRSYFDACVDFSNNKKPFIAKNEIPLSMHAIHSALGIMRRLVDNSCVNWDQSLANYLDSHPVSSPFLVEYRHRDYKTALIKFINELYFNGGFQDSIGGDVTINATASAVWCLWQLGALDELTEKIPHIISFVERHKVNLEDGSVGYKNSDDCEQPYVCSTYYAFRIFYSLSQFSKTSIRELINLNEETALKIRNFVLSAKVSSMGYAPVRNMAPTIIHTKNALALFQNKYELDFMDYFSTRSNELQSIEKDVSSFLSECAYTDESVVSGFAERKFYYPNIYATQLNIEIRKLIKSNYRDPSGVKIDDILSKYQIEDVARFLMSCRDKTTNKYRSYSYDSGYIPLQEDTKSVC